MIVAPEVRHRGVGPTVVDAALTYPKVVNVKSAELVHQPRPVSFYAVAFTTQVGASCLMRRSIGSALVPR